MPWDCHQLPEPFQICQLLQLLAVSQGVFLGRPAVNFVRHRLPFDLTMTTLFATCKMRASKMQNCKVGIGGIYIAKKDIALLRLLQERTWQHSCIQILVLCSAKTAGLRFDQPVKRSLDKILFHVATFAQHAVHASGHRSAGISSNIELVFGCHGIYNVIDLHQGSNTLHLLDSSFIIN